VGPGGLNRVALEGRSGERRAAGSALTLSDGSEIGEPSREAVRIDRPSVLVSIRDEARTWRSTRQCSWRCCAGAVAVLPALIYLPLVALSLPVPWNERIGKLTGCLRNTF
jgi:hypothetical protein